MDRAKASLYSPAPLRVTVNLMRRNRVVVELSGFEYDGSIIDLTSMGDVRSVDSDKEEYGMGDGA